jgi:tRNA (guanine37-N1)-methyltransferase
VLGNPQSTASESFRNGLLEEPHYTRPAEFRGWPVPEVLLSGDHAKIDAWRREQRQSRTKDRRPDLFAQESEEID